MQQCVKPDQQSENNKYSLECNITNQAVNQINSPDNSLPIQPIQQKDMPDNKKQQKNDQQQSGNKHSLIEIIMKSKQKTMKQLDQLQRNQLQLKAVIQHIKQAKAKRARSTFTAQERKKIQHILKQVKQSEQDKIKNHERVIKSLTDRFERQKVEQKQIVEKLRNEHRKAVQHNMVSIQLRKKLRQQTAKQASRRALELKNKKYSYLLIQKQKQISKSNQKANLEHKLCQIKQKFKFDIKQINQHNMRYSQVKKSKNQQRIKRYSTQKADNESIKKFEKSVFRRVLQDEDKIKNIELIKKQNKPKQLRWKMSEFSTMVRQQYVPKQNQHKSISTSPSKKQVSALSQKQRISQGNQYLRIAKKLRKQKDDPRLITEPHVIKYIDYLKKINTGKKAAGTLQKFKHLVNSSNSIDLQSAQKASYLLTQIQSRSKKGRDQKIFETIQNKIDLLKVLL